MALQQINWNQINTENVQSGSIINLGNPTASLHHGYFDYLYISGQTISDFVTSGSTYELNVWSSSIKEVIQTTGSNLTVKGNLTVLGTTTSINSNIVTIDDNILSLNGTGDSFGGIQVNDPTNPSKISGSLLWDSTNDKWVAGPLGSEDFVILEQDLTDFSSSVTNLIDDVGIFRQTGSFFSTTNDLQMTGSVTIKGNLRVEGTTTLIQTIDPNIESLVVSGAMSIVENQINAQIVSASIKLQNIMLAEHDTNLNIIDCGDGFF